MQAVLPARGYFSHPAVVEKLESGKVSLVREWRNVADLVQRSIEVMQNITQEAGVAPSILFSVQDQGKGISAKNLESIFGRFQQVPGRLLRIS